MLNDSGPKTKPSGTADNISSHELYDVLMFVLSFLQYRQLYIDFDTDKLKSYTFTFAMERSFGRQSKAFERSIKRELRISPHPQTFYIFLS